MRLHLAVDGSSLEHLVDVQTMRPTYSITLSDGLSQTMALREQTEHRTSLDND